MSLIEGPVLITGARGFVGRHLQAAFEARGIDFIPLSSRDADLRDFAATRALFAEHPTASCIVHLAAWQAAGDFPARHPGEQFLRNAEIHLSVLEAWRSVLPRARLVALGTSCAYPTIEGPLREEDLLRGPIHGSVRFYGMTRRLLHEGIEALGREFGLHGAFLIPATMFGEYDDFDESTAHVVGALVARFVDAALEGREEVVVWGDGRQVRDFLYAGDFATCLAELLPRLEPGALNLGPGKGVEIGVLARLIAEAAGFEGRILFDASRYTGIRAKFVDATRLAQRYGIVLPEDLRPALRKTVAWYREHREECLGRRKFAGERLAGAGR